MWALWLGNTIYSILFYIRYKIFIFLIIGPKMGILINNMKIIHTSTSFTLILIIIWRQHRNQREIIIRRKGSVSHKEDTIDEYIYYIKKSLKIIIVFFTLNNFLGVNYFQMLHYNYFEICKCNWLNYNYFVNVIDAI